MVSSVWSRLLPPILISLSGSANAVADVLRLSKIQSDCGTLYKVESSDGCWAIAEKAMITQAQLLALNPGLNCDTLRIGDGICLGVPCGETYVVQPGEWCEKIITDKKLDEAELKTLNPGLNCPDLFPGQKLCIAPAPILEPPPLPDQPNPPATGEPTVPCSRSLAVAVGDTCSGLADSYGIQLSQFMAMNTKLDCDQPSNLETEACVFRDCEQLFKVQEGDGCSKIETEAGLSTGKLVELNPGLACDKVFPNQNLCVEPAKAPEPDGPKTYNPWKKYPTFAIGDLPKSPLVSFVNAEDSRDTFFGDMIFQLDSQHKELFNRMDLNKDGKVDKSELDTMYAVYPHIGTGVGELDDSITQDNFVENMIKSADTNGDNAIDEEEYMAAVFSAQNLTSTSSEIAIRARMLNDVGMHQKRVIPLLVAGALGLLGILAVAGFVDMMHEMEKKARDDAGDLLNYLDVTFWDRGNEPEPKCAAYMYYSSSCAALGHHWSSHCSEGGEKVYPSSCRGLFKDGSKACGFLGCSSLCYKVNTENCDCDALKYTTQTKTDYEDTPMSNTQEKGVGPCRNKCRGAKGCAGFTISKGKDDNHVTCKVFSSLSKPQSRDDSVAFKLVGGPVGSGTNPICPRVPDGYFPLSPEQEMNDEMVGDRLSDKYSDLMGSSFVAREDSYDPRGKRNLTMYEDGTFAEDIVARADESFDPRGKYSMYVKDQGKTSACVSHSFSTMVEGTIQHAFNRPTVSHPISPVWIHKCRIGVSQKTGSNWHTAAGRVGDSYLATEDCMKMTDWVSNDKPSCTKNGCAKSQYGKLPYVTKTYDFALYDANKKKFEDIKNHIKNVGPVFLSTSIPTKFQKYAAELAKGSIPKDTVFFDTMERYSSEPRCTPSGHAMTVVGYGHYRRPNGRNERLYWIVQNSWGSRSGDGGFVYIDFASLGAAKSGPYGVNVKEGTQWVYNDLPPHPNHDEL